MGSKQSVHKLTITNEENLGVIEVSDAVVQRLAQGVEKPVQTVHTVTPTTPVSPAATKPTPQSPQSPPPSGGSNCEHSLCYHPELTLTALQMQKQKEQEFQEQDQYWAKRIRDVENQYGEIRNLIETEYKKARTELADKKPTNLQETIQPCLESRTKVLKCYEEYPREILKCSSLVEEFSNCVDQRRARVIAARC